MAPRGQGQGGRGRGQDPSGKGRGMGGGRGLGPGANCICPDCGHKLPHERGTPCLEVKCPKCGKQTDFMKRPHYLYGRGKSSKKKAEKRLH